MQSLIENTAEDQAAEEYKKAVKLCKKSPADHFLAGVYWEKQRIKVDIDSALMIARMDKELKAAKAELSDTRQLYYEVVDQRNKFHSQLTIEQSGHEKTKDLLAMYHSPKHVMAKNNQDLRDLLKAEKIKSAMDAEYIKKLEVEVVHSTGKRFLIREGGYRGE